MNIYILSNIGGYPDEGQKNVASCLSSCLSKKNKVVHLNARENIFSKRFWETLRRFKPDIIHIFLRPNVSTFLYGKILQILYRQAKVVISALQPPLNLYLAKITIPFLKVDVVLTLSKETERFFAALGCKTTFLVCGVDTEKFVPVTEEKKIALREKYGIDKDKFIILHVGSITAGRNLFDLVKLQKTENNQVVVVTNTSFAPDPAVYSYLKNNGCIVFRKYFENIEEIYQLADCYLFPTLNPSNCIEMPLSILEAMACNLPVITTRFGAIPRVFTNGDGLFFVDNMNTIPSILNRIKNKTVTIKTRKKVVHFTWENIAQELEKIYRSLLIEK